MIKPKQIRVIASSIGIKPDELETFGSYKAKVSLKILKRLAHKPNAKLINVTTITPTKFGEGKTSTAIGLTQALSLLQKRVVLCLREPSLGPTFGIKGGGCGSGLSQIIPMDDINLHFTRDVYAVSSAHNLISSILDNHIYNGNDLSIDLNKITWRRVIDINDRSLRNIIVGYKKGNKKLRYETGFDITASSEIMAILALTTSINDLKKRISRIIVAYTKKGNPVTVKDLKITGAVAALLRDAIKPNLVQTLEGQPAFVHTGPFANIAHGNNSFLSLVIASKLADYVVTENGFGADLGAEKYFNIVCRQNLPQSKKTLKPALTVLVVSLKAVKVHGSMDNLKHHIDIIRGFGVEPVVAINRFPGDSMSKLVSIKKYCKELGVEAAISEVVAKGGAGGIELAQTCLRAMLGGPPPFEYLYELNDSIKEKISKIAKYVYGADGVVYTKMAKDKITKLTALGFSKLPINIAKTFLSLTDDSNKKGVPSGWKLKITDVKVSAGAGFIVPMAGAIRLMPGLPKKPAAEKIDIDDDGNIRGLS